MKIQDLYESSPTKDHEEHRKSRVMNIVMMAYNSGTNSMDTNSLISEIEKDGTTITIEELIEIVDELEDFSMSPDGEQVTFGGENTDLDDISPNIDSESEYNPASAKAKEATRKRR